MKPINENRVILLAYLHRYWMLLGIFVGIMLKCGFGLTVVITALIYLLWNHIGYCQKWRHLCCSYQDSAHQTMNPYVLNWEIVRKSDLYGIPIIFLLLGLANLYFEMLG